MRVGRGELYAGRALLIALIAVVVLPFISIFTTALHPSRTVPVGLEWPADPQWGNFIEAFNVANRTHVFSVNSTLYNRSGNVLSYNAPFGQVTGTDSTLYRERQIQFAARFQF